MYISAKEHKYCNTKENNIERLQNLKIHLTHS